jgi:hypothetical protein
MLSEPRAIFFHTELQIPPVEDLKIKKEQVRRLYVDLCKPGSHSYENLDLQAETPTLSTRRPDGESICRWGGHRLVIEEKNPEVDVDGFVDIVNTVLQATGVDFAQLVFLHRVRIECLAQPGGSRDSIDLLAGKVANVLGAEEPFERYPSFFGVRFRFHPKSMLADDDDDEDEEAEADEEADSSSASAAATNDLPSGVESERSSAEEDPAVATDEAFITLRFETHGRDVTQVWMEVSAEYLGQRVAPAVGTNIRETYTFLTEKAKKFLDQFDVPREGEG